MTACRFNGIVDAQPSGSSRADYIALRARLRNQIFESRVQIAVVVQFPCLFCAAAFAVAALIDCERVDSGGCQLAGQVVPRCACAVALMEEQHAGAWLRSGKKSGLQQRAVSRLQVNSVRSRRR